MRGGWDPNYIPKVVNNVRLGSGFLQGGEIFGTTTEKWTT